jgi:predicted nucleic acid-binding protein
VPGRSIATACMSDERFTLDTNLLVDAMDGQAGPRQSSAAHIIGLARQADCWLALQAISEFYAAVTRKRLIAAAAARDQALDWLTMFPTTSASARAVRDALALAATQRASYWDALLLCTVAETGCTAMLTEDLADGTTLAGVRIINPFAGDALSPDAAALLKSG